MKQLSLFIILFISGLMLKAQAPEKINYQAVARDLSGNPLVNQTLNVTYEIRQSSPTGTSVYTETHTGISTNQFGLFTAEIGGGTPSTGTFAGINWGAGLHYLYVEVNGDPMGSSQLLSVPYALYSKQSANGPQGLPGKNSISIVTPEPTGANCQNGGNKIDIGTDDNGDNILQALEIDYTYYVCNGDSGATGLGVNWLGNGTNFPPTPNNENDAFYHSTHNTSYIYNGTTWDTLVSGNVGSTGFWSQSGNTIYNNNNSNSGNVSIGTTLSLSKLTVGSVDSTVATFVGNNANVAVIAIANANATGASGIAFVNGSNSDAFMAYSPSNKTLSIVNGVTDGHVFINSDSAIVNQTLVIANQAQRIANQAQTAIYNNTDTIYNYSSTTPIVHVNSGLFLTDSLYILGNNFLNTNWILANNGLGQAKWTDPNTLGLGNDNWGTQVIVSDTTLNGDGTAGNPLSVNGVLTDNQDLSLTGNTLSLTNDPTPVDLTPYLDNTDAQTLSLNTNVLSISNGNNVTLPATPNYTAGTGINITGTQPNFTINNTSPASAINITGGGITTVTSTPPSFTVSTPAQTLSYTAPNLTLSNGGGTVTLPTSPWTKTGSTLHPAIAGDNVGIGTTASSNKLQIHTTTNGVKNLQITSASTGATSTDGFEISNDGSAVLNMWQKENADWNFNTSSSGSVAISIKPNTNVGIGTSTAMNRLTVAGGASIGGGYVGNGAPANGLLVQGNVGIGTTSPLAKFHVEQNASAVMMLKEVTPTNGAAFVMESMSQFVLISNESGTFRIEDNTNLNQPFNINPTGQVGIGGDAFYSALDVYGRITMRNGATTGYVPVSDANGTMTWTDPNTLITTTPSLWTQTGANIHPTSLSGNVGVGTNNPGVLLDVQSQVNTTANLFQVRDNVAGIALQFSRSAITLLGATNGFRLNAPSNDIIFTTNNINRMTIQLSGNVGIGTTTPAEKLEVQGNIRTTQIQIDNGSSLIGWQLGGEIGFPSGDVRIQSRPGQNIMFYEGGTNENMRITAAGNVGIGTSTPSQKLDVDGGGSIEVDGEYTYETPKTRTISIPINALNQKRNNSSSANAFLIHESYVAGYYGESGYCYFSGGTNAVDAVATAPIYLPQGAVVTELKVKWFDSNTTVNAILSLERIGFNTINNDQMAAISTTGSATSVSGLATSTDNTILNGTIDNTNYSYYVKMFSKEATTNVGFAKIVITYTVNKAD